MCVVFYSCNKNNFILVDSSRKYFFNKQVFVHKVPHLYKRIHQHLDRQGFDWTKQDRWKRLHSGGEPYELRVEGAIPLAIIFSLTICLKVLGLVAINEI